LFCFVFLQCIAEFEESNPAVVQKLRELRDESESIKEGTSSGIDASTEMDFKKAIFGITGNTISTSTENDGYITLRGKGGEMGTDTGEDRNTLDESIETEDDLHIKHSQV